LNFTPEDIGRRDVRAGLEAATKKKKKKKKRKHPNENTHPDRKPSPKRLKTALILYSRAHHKTNKKQTM
jgi:hypothetical protein